MLCKTSTTKVLRTKEEPVDRRQASGRRRGGRTLKSMLVAAHAAQNATHAALAWAALLKMLRFLASSCVFFFSFADSLGFTSRWPRDRSYRGNFSCCHTSLAPSTSYYTEIPYFCLPSLRPRSTSSSDAEPREHSPEPNYSR